MKQVYIITGGTFNHVTPHFSVAAPAFGKVGEAIYNKLKNTPTAEIILIKTRMADPDFHHSSLTEAGLKSITTNEDLKTYINYLNSNSLVDTVVLSSAVADFTINLDPEVRLDSGKSHIVTLEPAEKLLPLINPNIFRVSFKTVYNSDHETFEKKGQKNLGNSDLILINDIKTLKNAIANKDNIYVCKNRDEAINILCMSIWKRLGLDNRRCRCGLNTPVTFQQFLSERCCSRKGNTIMSYETILKYKYGL